MLTREIEARVSWPDGRVLMQGSVALNYLADVDPWLVHMTFRVSNAVDKIDLERNMLTLGCGLAPKPGDWLGLPGTAVRIGHAGKSVRFRVTDPESGTWADFDVLRPLVDRFLADTVRSCDYDAEKAALAAYVDKALTDELGGLHDD